MQKFKDYIDRFFQNKKKNRNYTLSTDDAIAFVNEFQSRDGNVLFNAIITLFNYGYVKGYRAAMAEMKKGGETV